MKRLNAILPLTFVVFATLASCDTAEERAEKHFQSALELVQSGDAQRATVEFRNVFQLDPNHLEARRAYAQMLDAQGDTQGALRSHLMVVEQSPEDVPSLTRLSQIAIQASQWEAAERYGRKLGEVAPDLPDTAPIMLVLDYRDAVLGNDAAARADAGQRAEDLAADRPEERVLDGLLLDWLIFSGRERDALAVVDRTIAADETNLPMYRLRLSILNALGETPAIEEQLRRMVEVFPGDQAVRQTLFSWLVNQGDDAAAEKFLRELADSTQGQERKGNQIALVQFLRANKGDEAARAELDALIANNDDSLLFKSLRAGIDFDGGQQDAAMAEIEAVLAEAEPSDEKRNIQVALARMQILTGNQVGARALVEEVLAADSTHLDATKIKSEMLIDADKASEAIVMLRAALEHAPEDAAIFSLMAKAHERNGNRDLVGENLARAAEVSDRAPDESIRLAKFLSARDQFAPAEQALVEALRRAPTNLDLLNELGRLYLRNERMAEAAQVESRLRSLATAEADSAANTIQLAILQSENRSEDLIAMIEQLGSANNDNSRAVVAIMRTHINDGDMEAARAVIDDAIADAPEALDLQFASAVLSGVEGDVQGSRTMLRDVLAVEPRATNVWLALARSHASAGDDAAAEGVIDDALNELPEVGNILWAKAGYLERRGDIGGAIDIYEQLYDASSSSLVAANNLASLLTSYRETPETVERAYTIARRLRGIPQPAFQDTYGWIAYLRGELDQALEHLEPSAEGLPGDPLVQYHLARTYEALERPEDAARMYERAITVLGVGTNEAMRDVNDRLAAMQAALTAQEN